MSKSQTEIVIIAGVSCAGKTTMAKELVVRGWKKIRTTTSRLPRANDSTEDYNYHIFDNFQKLIDDHKLIEFDKYAGHYYGVEKVEINRAIEVGGKYVVILTDPGVKALRSYAKEKGVKVTCLLLDINHSTFRQRITARAQSLLSGATGSAVESVMKDTIERIFSYFLRDLPWVMTERLKAKTGFSVYHIVENFDNCSCGCGVDVGLLKRAGLIA